MIDGIDARVKDLSERSNSVSAAVICIILAACGMRRGRDAKQKSCYKHNLRPCQHGFPPLSSFTPHNWGMEITVTLPRV
jgi:hypothetical protein